MIISYTKYKDTHGIRVETKKITCVFLHNNGARLQSIVDNETGVEYLTQDPNDKFLPQTIDSEYVDNDVSGADDMFPTIDPIIWHDGKRAGKLYKDHGIVARLPFSVDIQKDKLVLETFDNDLLFSYRKTITETEDGFINVRTEISELLGDDFHCYWAFHIMINGEENGEIVTPHGENKDAKLCFDIKNEFGNRFDDVLVTKRMLTQNKFSENGNAYKFFWTNPIPEGYVIYKSKVNKYSIKLSYDKEKLPYVGCWINNGAFKGLYNTALEIATGPFDSPENAIDNGVDTIIKKNTTFSFDIKISLV